MEGQPKKTTEYSQRRLVVHWDINGTITPVDATEPGNVTQNANMVVAKSVYGHVTAEGTWQLNEEDAYRAADANSVTYYDFLKATDKTSYKNRSFSFTEPGEAGESLASHVPAVVAASEEFLFRSFRKALDAYPDALHVIRTFGGDGQAVLERLRQSSASWQNVSMGTPLSAHEIEIDGNKLRFDGEFGAWMLTTDKHVLIQENYEYWSANGRSSAFGKQLVAHPNLDQIFFDDNPCVAIRGDGGGTRFVLVNTLQAIHDDDYFVRHIVRHIEGVRGEEQDEEQDNALGK